MAHCMYCNKSICDCRQVCDSCQQQINLIQARTDLDPGEKDRLIRQLKQQDHAHHPQAT